MYNFYDGVKILLGALGALFALVFGLIISLEVEVLILVIALFYLIGTSVGPKVAFELANPYLKIYLVAGPLGISFVKLTIKVFTADGKISDNEIQKLDKYLTREFGKEVGIAAVQYIKNQKRKKENIYNICKELADLKPTEKATVMFQLFNMAASDKLYSKEEEEVLKKIAKYLKISEKRFFQIKASVIKGEGYQATDNKSNQSKRSYSKKKSRFYQQFFAPSSNPYFILGLSSSASNSEIKKTYRELMKKYHPDLAMDKSEQYRQQIMEKVQEINTAYELIKRIRGIK